VTKRLSAAEAALITALGCFLARATAALRFFRAAAFSAANLALNALSFLFYKAFRAAASLSCLSFV